MYVVFIGPAAMQILIFSTILVFTNFMRGNKILQGGFLWL